MFLTDNDSLWQKMAYNISKDKHLAKDLVQDMYLKLLDKKDIDEGYVFMTLRNDFYNRCKKKKIQIPYGDLSYLGKTNDGLDELENRKELIKFLNSQDYISWYEREVLYITHHYSLRDAEKETGVYYGVLNYHKTKALKKIKQNLENGRTKRQKD